MRLSLNSDLPELENLLAEYEDDDVISNIEVINFSQLADTYMERVESSYLAENKGLFTKAVDDVSQALQKMAIAIEKNKASQEDRDNANRAVQFQIAQIIVNYNRTIGKEKFKTGYIK